MVKTAVKKTAGRRSRLSSTPALHHSSTPRAAKRRAVFVDRDGVLNEMVYDDTHGLLDSPRRPSQVRLARGAAAFLRGARARGYRVIVVTNQPGLAKGTLSMDNLAAVNRRLARLLAKEGAAWDELRFCPHHPSGGAGAVSSFVRTCACRKPRPGMLLGAAREWGIDLARSWMVGDGLNDVQAGNRAGCRTILVTTLKLEQIARFTDMADCKPTAVASNLRSALRRIRGALSA